jgi:hypothetical protein
MLISFKLISFERFSGGGLALFLSTSLSLTKSSLVKTKFEISLTFVAP